MLVLGAVIRQSAVPWTKRLTLREAIMRAGGLELYGNARKINLAVPLLDSWPRHVTLDQVIDITKGDLDVSIPDRSVIIVPEKMLNW